MKNVKSTLSNLILKRIGMLELMYWLFFLFALVYKCLYFQFTTKLNSEPYISSVNIIMLLSTLAAIFIIIAFLSAVFNKGRLIALFCFNLLITVLLVADTNFFRYYYNLITIPVFYQFDVKLMSSINQSVMSLFQIKDIIYIVDLPFMAISVVLLHKNIEKVKFSKRFLRSAALFTAGIIIMLSILPKSNIYAFAYNNNYSTKSLGVFYSHFNSTKLFIENNMINDEGFTDDDKKLLQTFFDNEAVNKNFSKLNGVGKDKNLIIVQIEALQHFVINRKINGKEITPNLNKLLKESLYFNDIYYQVSGGNTSDAEFLCNNSLYPAQEGSVYIRFPENTYISLPHILRNKGYDTYALHAFEENFWNREEMYKSLDFERFISGKDFVMDDFAGWQGEALSDSSFFRQSLDIIDYSKPFYSFFVTLSTHHPFTYFEHFDFDTGDFEGTYMGNYLKAANYADKCVGEFVEDLKNRGLFDNSMLVLYGDHSAVPKIESEELMKFLNVSYSDLEWIKLQKVPLIIHYPGQHEGEVIETTGGQIDILPTIANMMDINTPYTIGKDLLNANNGYAILRNGSIITGDYVYFNDLREIYEISSGKPLDLCAYEKEINSFLKELEISDTIILKDAFKVLTENSFR